MRNVRIITALAMVMSLASPVFVSAAVSVPTGPTSLVTSPVSLPASSGPQALFSFNISQTAAETLSSVAVTISNIGASTATGSHFASVVVYKDNGDNVFSSATDLLAGSQTTMNVGSPTVVTTSANNTINGGKFYVVLSTSALWSASAPADSVTVTLLVDGIVTSANSPTVTAVTTAAISADTVGPQLTSAVAMNTGGTAAVEAGDSVVLTFNEATNKPSLTVSTIPTIFTLSGGQSFLDGLGVLLSAGWNAAGTTYTITLSSNVSLPTVQPGDVVTIAGSTIKDALGSVAAGSQTITGSFTTDAVGPQLTSAVAFNAGGTAAKEAGDSVQLTFGEATNKPTFTPATLAPALTLSSGHTWLDGAGAIGSAAWNSAGTVLTITLSAGTSLPTVAVGDTVTLAGSVVQDTIGNSAAGSQVISGNFGTPPPSPLPTGTRIRLKRASVTSVSTTTLTVTANGTTYTVNVTAATKFEPRLGGSLSLVDFAAGDMLDIRGRLTTASTVDASHIKNKSLRQASIEGTIASINTSTKQFVVTTEHGGTVTVTVSDDTTLKNGDQAATLADLQVGMTVNAKGLWNRTASTLTHVRRVEIKGIPEGEDEDEHTSSGGDKHNGNRDDDHGDKGHGKGEGKGQRGNHGD